MTIGFSRASSMWKLGSAAIQLAEKRNFSHVYIRYICPITQVDIIAQASKGYVNEINVAHFLEHNVIVEEYKLDCSSKQFNDVLLFIKQHLGVKYSQLQILVIAIKKLFNFSIPIDNKDMGFICSEFAARVCQIHGIRTPSYLEDYTPSDLNTLIKDIKLERTT